MLEGCSLQTNEGQVQCPEEGQVPDGRRQGAGESTGGQVEAHHSAVPSPSQDPLPTAEATNAAAVPRSKRVAMTAVGRRGFERKQRGLVAGLSGGHGYRDGHGGGQQEERQQQ